MFTDAEKEMEGLLTRWEELTGREHEAIEQSSWLQLADLHRRKRELQSRIRAHVAEVGPCSHQWLGRLVELERGNLGLLTERLEELRGQLSGLDLARSNLRRIQRSYAPRGCMTAGFAGKA